MNSALRLLGYWRSPSEPEYPDPHDLVDAGWSADERDAVVDYLQAGTYCAHFRGLSLCRFCGQKNGAREFTDGTYAWPEGLAHYLEVHGVRLPAEFVAHVIVRMDDIDAAERDLSWWLASAL